MFTFDVFDESSFKKNKKNYFESKFLKDVLNSSISVVIISTKRYILEI